MAADAFPSRSTPFPNAMLDAAMPALSDTEWRVLCVVVRSTLGWQGPGKTRKARDWLTQAQLKSRTGRAGDAVSRAVDGLVRRSFILVEDEGGEVLLTPEVRRAEHGRHYFRLHPRLLREEGQCPESGIRKPDTTKESRDKRKLSYGRRLGESNAARQVRTRPVGGKWVRAAEVVSGGADPCATQAP